MAPISKFLNKYKPMLSEAPLRPTSNKLYKLVTCGEVDYFVYRFDGAKPQDPSDGWVSDYGETKICVLAVRPSYLASHDKVKRYLQNTLPVGVEVPLTSMSLRVFAPVFSIEYLAPTVVNSVHVKYLPRHFFELASVIKPEHMQYRLIKNGTYITKNWIVGVVNNSLAHSLVVDFYVKSDLSAFCDCILCKRHAHVYSSGELLWFLRALYLKYGQGKDMVMPNTINIVRFKKNSILRMCL